MPVTQSVAYIAIEMLTTYQKLAFVSFCFLLYSCKSLQRLNARDTSAKHSDAKTKKRTNIRFLDGIAISGNSNPQAAEPQNTHAARKRKEERPQTIYAPSTDAASGSYNIENANGLQFKYAILLDALVERLSNVLLLQNMDHWWGTRYSYGGSTKDGIDCSAFTQIMLRDVYKTGISRTARAQYDNSNHIAMEELTQGDLVFFQTVGRDISHVGIYLTNNKFVHAATSGGVMISDLNDAYWRSRYKGAGRVLTAVQVASK